MNRNLLILGAGQYSYIVEEIAVAMGAYDKISFLDDNSDRAIGILDDLQKFKSEYSYAITAIGDPKARKCWMQRLEDEGYSVPTLIHPLAYVSKTACLGKGTIVEAFSGINPNATIGSGCIVSMGALVNHNSCVGDYCHIDCGAVISSNSCVPVGTKVCAGEIYR